MSSLARYIQELFLKKLNSLNYLFQRTIVDNLGQDIKLEINYLRNQFLSIISNNSTALGQDSIFFICYKYLNRL